MKYYLTIGILLICFICCKPNKSIEIDFCEMLTKDQSYVNHDGTDEAKKESNIRTRKQIFFENYKQLINLTKQKGFPNISFDSLPKDSCKYWAVTGTLIHIAQSKPEIFFSDETIKLFKEEISKGNLKSEDLIPAFKISFMTNEFCDKLEEPIKQALETWGMNSYLNTKPKFKKCN